MDAPEHTFRYLTSVSREKKSKPFEKSNKKRGSNNVHFVQFGKFKGAVNRVIKIFKKKSFCLSPGRSDKYRS